MLSCTVYADSRWPAIFEDDGVFEVEMKLVGRQRRIATMSRTARHRNKILGILKCSVLLRLRREVGRRRGYLQIRARHAKAGVELMPGCLVAWLRLRHSKCLALRFKHVSLVVPTYICGLDAP
jgi:hypothetical protein